MLFVSRARGCFSHAIPPLPSVFRPRSLALPLVGSRTGQINTCYQSVNTTHTPRFCWVFAGLSFPRLLDRKCWNGLLRRRFPPILPSLKHTRMIILAASPFCPFAVGLTCKQIQYIYIYLSLVLARCGTRRNEQATQASRTPASTKCLRSMVLRSRQSAPVSKAPGKLSSDPKTKGIRHQGSDNMLSRDDVAGRDPDPLDKTCLVIQFIIQAIPYTVHLFSLRERQNLQIFKLSDQPIDLTPTTASLKFHRPTGVASDPNVSLLLRSAEKSHNFPHFLPP